MGAAYGKHVHIEKCRLSPYIETYHIRKSRMAVSAQDCDIVILGDSRVRHLRDPLLAQMGMASGPALLTEGDKESNVNTGL